VSSDPKTDPKKIARDKARQWYRRIEDRVTPVVAFGGLVIENTCRWVFENRNPHPRTAHFHVKEFLRSPYWTVKRFLRAREVDALSSLWNLSWDPPTYSTPRRVYPVIHLDSRGSRAQWTVNSAPPTVETATSTDPLPTPPKDTPTE